MSETLLGAIITGATFIAAAVITIYFGSKTVAKKDLRFSEYLDFKDGGKLDSYLEQKKQSMNFSRRIILKKWPGQLNLKRKLPFLIDKPLGLALCLYFLELGYSYFPFSQRKQN